MKNTLLHLSIFLFLYNTAQLQNINSINLSGNIKTDSSIIVNAIDYQINTRNSQTIINDIKKLDQLGIFDSISINIQDNIYSIKVIEKKTFSYYPILKKNDGFGWSIGNHLEINNIKGSLSAADLSFTVGKIKSTELKYKKKQFELIYNYNQKESIEENYLNNELSMLGTYFINNNKKLYLTFGISKNKLKYYLTNELLSFDFFKTSITYKNNFIKTSLDINHALIKKNYSYTKLLIEYFKNIKIVNNSIQSNLIFRTNLILNSYPENHSIDYENLYLGGDKHVRGFNPNPFNNPLASANKLKFKSMIFQSVQFEVPFTSNQYIKSKLLLFNDFAKGSNNYKNFASNNKIKGYGFGIALIMPNNMRFDICMGLNAYGSSELHFFNNSIF